MNNLLSDLKREREERQKSIANTGGDDSGKQGGHSQAVGTLEAPEKGSRKRKQTDPKRRIRDAVTEDDCTAAYPSESLLQPAAATDNEGNNRAKKRAAGAGKATKQGKQPSILKISEGEFIDDESVGTFNAESIAKSLVLNDFAEGRDSLGELAYDTFAAAARVFSVDKGSAEVKVLSGGIVSKFKGNSGKVYSDRVSCYTAEQIEQIFQAVLTRGQSSRGRRTSNAHFLTLSSLAERFPPLLWSMYVIHGKSVSAAAKDLVARLKPSPC